MESYFAKYRENTIGWNHFIQTPYHEAIPLLYADWTASGRMYAPIEKRMQEKIFPLLANTHTDTNNTGMAMTYAYHKAQKIIKAHVKANDNDVLISSDSGMTGVVNKFQRILGLKIHESFTEKIQLEKEDRPIVFVTHMEHHSNQTSWLETIADVRVVEPNAQGLVCVYNFAKALAENASRKLKIAAITSCSNVTGILTPYQDIAQLMHENDGLCFVDFACSAPYIDIDMHQNDSTGRYLDAIYFSPHKFLGGPGTTGILVFNKKLYKNSIPDTPGGGTVEWTNPWGQHKYIEDIEAREDGGTPSFLQTIKVAMCMQLKEEMGVENIQKREEEILDRIYPRMQAIDGLHILAEEHNKRLGVISFYVDGLHYNVGVKLLNDRFGIQTRGGCSCAGTYGHYLLNVDPDYSRGITTQISSGDCSNKPGWIRLSIHPTTTNKEVDYLLDCIEKMVVNHREWVKDYSIDLANGIIKHAKLDTSIVMQKEMDDCFYSAYC